MLRAIADAGSLGRAASVLGCSQPAVSTQLRRRLQRSSGTWASRCSNAAALGCGRLSYGAEAVARACDIVARGNAVGRRAPARAAPRGSRPPTRPCRPGRCPGCARCHRR
ncbi:LysR family transcriptional regulator [Streptomyces sp. NPDC001508]|uniref:LysR family transcriptional regulator n=1 Tax=Streptomyces sp. NPDC001508 TaxID=3154656 RepID=UPI00332E07FA